MYTYSDEGGIAKMVANKLRVGCDGRWLLPFWREMGGQPECNRQPGLHGAPGVLASADQVTRLPRSSGLLITYLPHC